MIAEQYWKRLFDSWSHQPFLVRWLVLPVIGPAVITVYFGCMWPRTTFGCATILLIVYGYLLRAGLVGADIFARGAIAVAITYAGMVAMVYIELLVNALKDYLKLRIEQHYEDQIDGPDES